MPAHYLTTLPLQQQIDYVNDCQARVAADTLALEIALPFPLTAGDHEYDLPDNLAQLRAIFDGVLPLEEMMAHELMEALSGVGAEGFLAPLSYAVVGRKLYVLPVPTEAMELTLVYVQRTPAFTAQSELTLMGDEMELVEQLLDAYVAFDRGEIEVGVAGLTRYQVEAARLRRANRQRSGEPERRPVITHDRFL